MPASHVDPAAAAAAARGQPGAVWVPPVVLRRALAPADRRAAGVAAGVAAVATGLVTYYLATIWRARDPR